MDREEFQKAFGKSIAKAWTDEAFKAKLLADPTAVFKENGIEVPEGVEVKMLENTENMVHFVLPPPPAAELSDEDLDKVAGGGLLQDDSLMFLTLLTGRH